MLTGAASIPTTLAGLRGLPFGWEFAAVVILLTLLFYVRVYGARNRARQKSRQRPNRPSAGKRQ
jgi:hypothetical protein